MSTSYKARLLEDIKAAMKARDQERLTTLRMLHAQIKDAGTNAGREETDELVAEVVSKAIRRREQSIEQYRQGGREDLAEKEQREIEWIASYRPPPLGDAELETLVREAIKETGASSKKDLGRIMKAVMPKLKGRADGRAVNSVAQRLLS